MLSSALLLIYVTRRGLLQSERLIWIHGCKMHPWYCCVESNVFAVGMSTRRRLAAAHRSKLHRWPAKLAAMRAAWCSSTSSCNQRSPAAIVAAAARCNAASTQGTSHHGCKACRGEVWLESG
jgi:hypothetical protein